MIELVLVVVIAVVGLFAVFTAFNTTSTGTEKTAERVKVAAQKEKKATSQPKKKAPSKKEQQRKAAEDREIERLIQSSGKSSSGMATDKSKIVSLEDVTTKKGNNEPAKQQKVEVSTKQRLIEAEEGFEIVEKKDKAPSQKFVKAQQKKKEEQKKDKDLNKLFKAMDNKAKNSKGARKDKDSEDKKAAGSVTMRKKITSNAKDLWSERKWEQE